MSPFSDLRLRTLRERLDANAYVFRESEAILTIAGREIGLRMGLQPTSTPRCAAADCSWWQWCRLERLWSGPLAEAWRVGGHLVPYLPHSTGAFENRGLLDMGVQMNEKCGDTLHGDCYVVAWRSGLIQVTVHFKASYFHSWPRAIPAYPILFIGGLRGDWPDGHFTAERPVMQNAGDSVDVSRASFFFEQGQAGSVVATPDGLIIQPWTDLRILANKTVDNEFVYLDPATPDVLPPGVSRSFWLDIGLNGTSTRVARYHIPAEWYHRCGVIESDRPGPAAAMAARSANLIREETHKGGIDTGRVWRYLRRDRRNNKPGEDAAEWDGSLPQAMFTLAYQSGESPDQWWQLYIQQAYHAADVAVYHGSWMCRLEGSAVFNAPLPKFRFGGMVFGYLETGDPYLLEVARALAGVYMAMETALQPRSAMGRDTYPLASLLTLWDHSADALYLDFARQTATRLLRTQMEDGGFAGQAGVGTYTGISSMPRLNSIGFGNGLLAPIALLEWARRDPRWPTDFVERVRSWIELMLRLQLPDGLWPAGGTSGKPKLLVGTGAFFSLIKAGTLVQDDRCPEAVRKFLATAAERGEHVTGTHAYLSAMYAHVADGALTLPAPAGSDGVPVGRPAGELDRALTPKPN
jgi:hypothetical protein